MKKNYLKILCICVGFLLLSGCGKGNLKEGGGNMGKRETVWEERRKIL